MSGLQANEGTKGFFQSERLYLGTLLALLAVLAASVVGLIVSTMD